MTSNSQRTNVWPSIFLFKYILILPGMHSRTQRCIFLVYFKLYFINKILKNNEIIFKLYLIYIYILIVCILKLS